MRAAIYARYSSDLQSETSIDDQLAVCKAHVENEAWGLVGTFSDSAISGTTLDRPGLSDLMQSAKQSGLDVVVAESLDRLSRDQEDIAGLYKRLTAWQVQIVTLSEGLIGELHIGLKGTMNALFLKDLGAKALRGQLGKARAGLAAGGIPYGYRVLKEIGPDGEINRGQRQIVDEEAKIVRRIFEEYAAGRSAVAIAKGLNADGVPSPRGGTWNPSTIQGHKGRGVGLLHNRLYVGKQVFNRHAFVRDPDTGTRRARMKDREDWVEADVPHLAIIEPDLWGEVQTRLRNIPQRRPELNRRPKRLFSGLVKCSQCGHPMTIAYRDRYGCANARQKGTCTNTRTVAAPLLEERILNGLRDQMMQPELVETFIAEFQAEIKRLRRDETRREAEADQQRAKLQAKIDRLVDIITEGNAGDISALTSKLRSLESELIQLPELGKATLPNLDMNANAVHLYQQKLDSLRETLTKDDRTRDQATEALRGLVDRVIAIPGEKRGEFDLELHGYLAQAIVMGMHGNDGGGRGIRTLDTR